MSGAGRTIALFPWGDVIEEFLDPIGLTAGDFASQMTGGWLFGYVAALQQAGWRPIIIAASEKVLATTRLDHAGSGAPIWLVPGRRGKPGRSPSIHSVKRWLHTPRRALRKVIEDEQCRALLIQEYEYVRFDILARLAQQLGIPAIATFQGGDQTLSWIEEQVRPRSMALCAGLLIASSGERLRVEQTYRKRPPILSVPNPLDTDEWRASDRVVARRELGLPADAFIAINHGRIDIHRKGLDILLAAWAAAPPGDRLVIIGSGQDQGEFSRLLESGGHDNVHWIASYTTDRALVRRWLSAADIYVTASRVEGMPVAPLEAMACGLPIVATDAQGLPDILNAGEKSGGLLIARDDVPALAAAIDTLRRDPERRRRLGEAARRRVEHGFSTVSVSTALDQFLGSLIRT